MARRKTKCGRRPINRLPDNLTELAAAATCPPTCPDDCARLTSIRANVALIRRAANLRASQLHSASKWLSDIGIPAADRGRLWETRLLIEAQSIAEDEQLQIMHELRRR